MRGLLLFLLCAALPVCACADEIHLKDGSQIVGSIVGYEGNAFKVETSYGFAMVRKDSITEIIPGDAKKPIASKIPPPQSPEAHTSNSVTAAVTPDSLPAVPISAPPAPPRTVAPLEPPRVPVARSKPLAPPVVKSASLAMVPDLPEPVAPPAPTPPGAQEFLRGNLYVNQTYGFEMFRPPGWELQQDATAAMPNAITALGTIDETTLLVIGRDIARDLAKDPAARGA